VLSPSIDPVSGIASGLLAFGHHQPRHAARPAGRHSAAPHQRLSRARGGERRLAVAAAALGLACCTHRVEVPPIELGEPTAPRQPGHYAVLVQTGAWQMRTEITGVKCAFDRYTADLDEAWESATRRALSAAFDDVTFVSGVIAPPLLASFGYDAMLVITPSNASSRLRTGGLFEIRAVAETHLEAVVTMSDREGTRQQEAVAGQGSATARAFLCSDLGPAIEQSGEAAIRHIVRNATAELTRLLEPRLRPR
jgi:hypothetical protein